MTSAASIMNVPLMPELRDHLPLPRSSMQAEAEAEGEPPDPRAAHVAGTARQNQRDVWEVTTEEFRGQDSRYSLSAVSKAEGAP